MPLPWRFNKRMLMRKDNESKQSSSNCAPHIQMQTHARKSSHRPKSNQHEIKKTNCVQPKGIMFNYNIQKHSTHTTNENKCIIKENQNNSFTKIEESNAQENKNDDVCGVDESNIVPNKMYKIVVVDGKIMLAEHNADDIIEEHVEENNDDNDSDVEFFDTDEHVEVNKIDGSSLKKYEIAKEVENKLSSSEHKINSASTKPMSIIDNHHDYCTVPKILNQDAQSGSAKTYTRRDLNESFVKKLTSINGPNSSSNNMYTTKKDLADARSGKAMVLLPLQKYTTLKKKLTDMQNEKEKWLASEIEYKKEKIEAEKKVVKKCSMGIQTGRCHGEELDELTTLKSRLARVFTEAQINMISNSKKLRDIVWSDSEMEKVVFLKQIISQTAYVFLKYKMHFPLPPLSAVRQWMIEKNIYVKPKKKAKIKKLTENSTNVVGEEINLETAQGTLPLESQNANVHNESLDLHPMQTQTAVSETAQAVNTIIDDQQPQDLEFGTSIQVHHTLSIPTDTGEQFVYYTYDNINNENDANNANYMPDDNIATVEEIVHSEVNKPRRRTMVDARLRCRLCMRPFDTEEEVREHVPLHYYNTYYTNYLDAMKPFVCEFCNEAVRHRFELVHHHRIHLGINSLKCWYPGCTYVGKNVDNLKSHHDCHNSRSFKCEECGALFKTHKYMRQHRARRHAARALLRCELCRATCLTQYTYRKHMDSHKRPPRIKCVEAGCAESFYSRAAMRKHVSAQHRREARPYRCALCPRAAYAHEAQLTKHLHKHETHKISHCMKCLKVFYDYGEFYTHYMEHQSEAKCKCACGERFITQEQLGEHKLQCTFVSGDNTKKTRKRKRKRKNEENQVNNPSNEKPKRKKIKDVQQNSSPIEKNNILHEKTYEHQVSVVNQSFEQDQSLIAADAIATPGDINEKVITLQIKDKGGVIKLANNYPSVVTNNYTQQVISTTDSQLQKFIVIPKHHQKVLTISGNHQQKVVANAGNHQQNGSPISGNIILKKLLELPKNYQHDINFMSENVSRHVISVPENNLQNAVVVSNDQQRNIMQENELPPLDSEKKIVQVTPDKHQIKNIIPVTKGHYPKKLTPIAKGSALEKMIAMSTVDKIILGPEGNYIKKVLALPIDSPLKKIMAVPEGQLTKVITDPESPLKKVVTDAESPVKKLITDHGSQLQKVITNHESPLQKVITDGESPIQKIITGTEKQVKKVKTLLQGPVKNVIAVPERLLQNVIAVPERPLQNVIAVPERPLQNVIAVPERPLQNVKAVPERPLQNVIAVPERPLQNVKAVPERPLQNVIAVPEMQYQNKIIAISDESNPKIVNATPKENQMKKVIKITKAIIQADGTTALRRMYPNKVVVQIPGTKNLQRVTGITREQFVSALASRPKKLIPISTTTNNNNQTTAQENNQEVIEMSQCQVAMSMQEGAAQPDMPLLDFGGVSVQENVQQEMP